MKEDKKMKKMKLTRMMAYIGAGSGVVLFGLMGILPGSFLGGVLGLNIAGTLFGMPVYASLAARLIVGVSMLMGVMVSGLIFVSASAVTGWLLGYTIASVRMVRPATAEVKN